ncbi:MAG: ABC transporter substrate-binding protein [Parcubacteria group bacterium]
MNEDQNIKFEIKDKNQSLWSRFYLSLKIKLKKFFQKNKFFNNQKANKDIDHKLVNKKLIYNLAPSKIPSFKQLRHVKKFLSSKEKRWINISILLIVISVSLLGWGFYQNNLETVPSFGGEYSEGLVGGPRYINPLYAFSDVDSDLSFLIYSRLFKYNGNGDLEYDLIKDYEIQESGRIYILNLRDDVYFHDGEKLTANDVVFTLNAIKNPDFRSPLRSIFSGVGVEKVDDYTIKLSLAEAYAGFEELLTFGILSERIWLNFNPENANLAEENIMPTGSGPYMFDSFSKNEEGNIKEYRLLANEDYYHNSPYIEEIMFKFYPDFYSLNTALNNDEVEGISYISNANKKDIIAQNSINFHNLSVPQITSIFFNQDNNDYLSSKNFREALALSINKDEILTNVFGESVRKVDAPILPECFAYNNEIDGYGYNLEEAKELLEQEDLFIQEISQEDLSRISQEEESEENSEVETEDSNDEENVDDESAEDESFEIEGYDKLKALSESAGLDLLGKWLYKENDEGEREYQVLSITITDTQSNKDLAERLSETWKDLGIRTVITVVSAENIQTQVIEPREFEILIYGQALNFDPDPYAYWHSGQDLNIVNYSNEKVDTLLEEARITLDEEERAEKYKEFQEIIHEEIPAIFLYSPLYIYPQNKKVKGFNTESILKPEHRFSNINNWYIKVKSKFAL